MSLRSPRIQAAVAPLRKSATAASQDVAAEKSARPRDAALQERLRALAAARAEVKEKAAAETAACKRRARRKQTALPGLITFKTMRTQIPCTVADMSGTGAQIRVTHATATAYNNLEDIPDRLTLVLRTDRVQVDCEVKWRRTTSIGVRFLGPPTPLPKG